MLQDAGLLRGLAGALARQRDARAFTAAARALFPVPNQPRVPDTTVPWPEPCREGACSCRFHLPSLCAALVSLTPCSFGTRQHTQFTTLTSSLAVGLSAGPLDTKLVKKRLQQAVPGP